MSSPHTEAPLLAGPLPRHWAAALAAAVRPAARGARVQTRHGLRGSLVQLLRPGAAQPAPAGQDSDQTCGEPRAAVPGPRPRTRVPAGQRPPAPRGCVPLRGAARGPAHAGRAVPRRARRRGGLEPVHGRDARHDCARGPAELRAAAGLRGVRVGRVVRGRGGVVRGAGQQRGGGGHAGAADPEPGGGGGAPLPAPHRDPAQGGPRPLQIQVPVLVISYSQWRSMSFKAQIILAHVFSFSLCKILEGLK